MALTYAEQAEEISKASFYSRVAQAAVDIGAQVMAESAATAGHTDRVALAQRVFRDATTLGKEIGRGVLTNPNCGTGVDDPLDNDEALEFVVSSLWNAFAGYSAAA